MDNYPILLEQWNMIIEMFEMQKALDASILKDTEITDYQKRMALIDEVGELTHELKGDQNTGWCWWKKTSTPINETKVLEELVDIWHFVLSYNETELTEEVFEYANQAVEELAQEDVAILLTYLVQEGILPYLLGLTLKLGEIYNFGIIDVYNEYKRKNKVNFDRLNNNY